jgi:16S rRNA (uracil1498-N3)-methyltransferase
MRLHRFYINQDINPNTQVLIQKQDVIHQMRRVFRLKKDDSVIVFNGTHFDYECKIDEINDKSTIVSVRNVSRSPSQPSREIYLYAALVKKDTFEWIVQKATELGVTKIIPVLSERSEKKSVNKARLEKIAIEASEQSGRGSIPVIEEVRGFEDALERLEVKGQTAKVIAFHTEGERLNPRIDLGKDESVACFIGPEGGWSDHEIEMFHTHGIPVRSLGDQVLRAETAVVSALSMVVFG